MVDVAGAEVVVVDVFVQGFRTILVKTTRLRDPGPKLVLHLGGEIGTSLAKSEVFNTKLGQS